ncbi:MAG: TonB-dependent receptor [Bacteroidota bacterium]
MRFSFPLLTVFFLLCSVGLYAQRTVQGTVTSMSNGEPLVGAVVQIVGTKQPVLTNEKGAFSIAVPAGNAILRITYVGYQTVQFTVGTQSVVNVRMELGSELDNVVVVGSRNQSRTKTESPVPVDVIPIAQVINDIGQVDLNQILTFIAPSFQSSRQAIADGTDHIDPAQLRGLGPDQVLVLINGKRRHQSALVNANGTVNRGTVGTDLNAIPANAIERIEILRDGAAAQYGSDAIAGVINIVLKQQTGTLVGNVSVGQHMTTFDRDFIINNGNFPKSKVTDGRTAQVALNYGLKVGKKGFLNLTGEYTSRGETNRGGTYTGPVFPTVNGQVRDDSIMNARSLNRNDFDMRIGNSRIRGGGVMYNFSAPINGTWQLYAFGGYNRKKGNAAGFYRYPSGIPAGIRNSIFAVYPNGFLPEINSDVVDFSTAVGAKGKIGKWNADFSNTYGRNTFDFRITNSVNFTQASVSSFWQKEFDAGGLQFTQNTTNADLSRKFDVKEGLNVAFGAEYRIDQFSVRAGEEASYKNYNTAAGVAAGAQVFAGFQPSNSGTNSRNNVSVYVDVEQDFTKKFMAAAALRYENYSDFGGTLNYKLATRYKITDEISVRGSASSGFRAPSQQQKFYARTNTLFISSPGGLVPTESGTFTNESVPAQILGIPRLKQETSTSYTLGFTAKFFNRKLEFSLDAYQINIKDRIVLTNNFTDGGDPVLRAQLAAANAQTANFFSNAIDTRARGLEAVLSYNARVGRQGQLRFSWAGTFIDNSVVKDANGKPIIKASPILVATGQIGNYFNREDQSRIEVANPQNKHTFMVNYRSGKFSAMVRAVRFGKVVYLDPTINLSAPGTWPVNSLTGLRETLDQTFNAHTIVDLTASYEVLKGVTFTVGGNNVFDVYQDRHMHSNNFSLGRFVYSRRVQQFGFNGAYFFTRLRFTL